MKKINFLKALAIVGIVSTTALVSCEDDLQPDYPAGREKPTVSFESATYEVNEGKDLEITLVSSEVFNDDLDFQLDIVKANSTAQDIEDFELDLDGVDLDWGTVDSYMITIPKFQSTSTFTLSAILDDLIESDEVVYLKITSKGNLNGDVGAVAMTEVKINQRGSNLLGFAFSFNQEFDFGGTMYSLCDLAVANNLNFDNDYLYFDDNGNFVDYIAATADCVEVGELDVDALGAGTWHIQQNLYDNGGLSGAGITPAFAIPTTVEYSRGGSVLNGTYVQAAANAVNSDSASDPDGNFLKYVVSFTIDANGIVTLFDATTSTTIGTGKSALPKFKKIQNLKKRNK